MVLDTGVLVSAFAFGGVPAKAVIKAFREADICVSPDLLKEYRDTPLKLEEQGKITHQQMQALIAGIAAVVSSAVIVYPAERFSLCRDPEDDMVIECCYAAKATKLISGDKDLLQMTDLPFAIQILTAQAFVKE